MSNTLTKIFAKFFIAFAVFGAVAVLAFLMPNTAEASCGSDEVLATDGNCYDADLYDPDDLCDAGYDEYCEDSGGGGDCDSDEVLASDGRCYDADLYDPDDLCDAGYSEYCDSGGSNNDEPESCSSGEVLASDGRCYDADLYDPQDLCDAGYREYCNSGGTSSSSTGGATGQCGGQDCYQGPDGNWYYGSSASSDAAYWCQEGYSQYCGSGGTTTRTGSSGGGTQNDAGNYSCPDAAEYANSRGVDDAEWDRLYNYAEDHVCGGADLCANESGDQYRLPDGYARDSSGNCFPDGTGAGYYIGENNEVCSQSNPSVRDCDAGYPNCGGEWVLDVNGAHICVPEWDGGEGGEEDENNNDSEFNDEEENNNEEDNTIPDQCSNITGHQSSVPANCTRNSNGTCSANPGYQIMGNQCLPTGTTERSCNIQNGDGTQTWNGSSWGTCTVESCDAGYEQSGNQCVRTSSSGVFLILVDDSAKEGGDTASFRVSRGSAALLPLDVNLSFSGNAVRGTDYTVSGGGISGASDTTATIGLAQAQSGLITLTALTDEGYEAIETASISLAPSSRYTFGIPSRIDITIRDSRAALPTITSFYGDRVRSGNPSTLHWSMNTIADLTCSISPDPTDDSGTYAVGSANGTVVTIPLLHQKLYTLTCSNGASSISVNATVSILPAFEEI